MDDLLVLIFAIIVIVAFSWCLFELRRQEDLFVGGGAVFESG